MVRYYSLRLGASRIIFESFSRQSARTLTFAAIRLGGSLGQATWTGCGQIDDTVLRRGEWQLFINEGAGRGWGYMCV